MVRPGPNFSVQDVHNGYVDAFTQLGVHVEEFQLDDRLTFFSQAMLERDGEMRRAFDHEAAVRMAASGLKEVLYAFWPQVVVVTSGFFIPPDFYPLFRDRGHKLVALFTESPYEDDRQLERAGFFDLVLVNDPTNLEAFRAVNPNSHYLPHSYNPLVHRPGPALPNLTCDVSFVGTGYPSRAEFFRAVDWEGLTVHLGGHWAAWKDEPWFADRMVHPIDWCMENSEAVDLYRSSTASLNLYRKEASADATADGWACGPREIELAACGTFFLREPRGESDELFPMLPTITDPAEVRPLLDWWLANDTARLRAADDARRAIADRTFVNHAKGILSRLAV